MKKIGVFILIAVIISLILLVGVVSADDDNDSDTGSDKNIRDQIRERTKDRIENWANKTNYTQKEREDVLERILDKVNRRTGLNITEDDVKENSTRGAILRAYLSNGRYAYVRVLPEEAAERAKERAKARCEVNNCTFELREVKIRNETYAVYRVKVEKNARVFWIFKTKMNVDVDVDAETGEVIVVKKPWWAGFSSEEDVEVDSETELNQSE